ncbi:MAG TPA: nitroreductase/quinone reductase family protein [Ruania sp.]|nr:nitroreductase/quinone reductase family protein [Ruania sp.]
MNAVPAAVLRTPLLHRLLSGRYLLLTFTGRSTGRRYRTPVAYWTTPEGITFSTDSRWWRNLLTEPTVELLLRGRRARGVARPVHEVAEAAELLGHLVHGVPGYRRAAGLRADRGGRVSAAELVRAVTDERRVFAVQVLA